MKKVELLFQEYERSVLKNWMKIISVELIVVILALSLYQNQTHNGFILTAIILLIILGLSILFMQVRKYVLINFCKKNYKIKKDDVIKKLESQQKFYFRSFNLAVEDKLFNQVLQLLKNK